MIAPSALFFGLVVPALVAAAIVLAGRTAAAPRSAWIAGAALAAAYALGHAGFHGRPAIPPRAVEEWIPLAAGVAAVAGVVTARSAPWLGWILRTAVLGASLALWLGPMMTHRWTAAHSAAWLGGLLGLALAALSPLAAWSACATALGGTAAALALSGSVALGQLAAAGAAAAGGGLAATAVRATSPIGRASVADVAVLGAGLVVCGTFYSELPRSSAVLLFLAPLAAGLVPAGRTAGVRGAVAVLGAVGLVAAVAVALAFAASPAYSP
jgi:hypothetical protein